MSKNKKHKKFKHIWSNQTKIGERFGLSGIAVGKILIENGLKDKNTKFATNKAIAQGYAISTPLQDGTPFFMWNKEKLKDLISGIHKPLTEVEFWVNRTREAIIDANKSMDNGNDKIGFIMMDCAYDEIPKNIKEEVVAIIEKEDKATDPPKQKINPIVNRKIENIIDHEDEPVDEDDLFSEEENIPIVDKDDIF
ncbi:MAG: hypothetical protein AABY32_04325 [Nanoarchaeota archaeon]